MKQCNMVAVYKRWVAVALALTVWAGAACAGELDGLWRNEQDGYVVRIHQDGARLVAVLQVDHQYSNSDLWAAGDVETEATRVDANGWQGRQRIIYTKPVKEKCPAVAADPWTSVGLVVSKDGKMIVGAMEDRVINLGSCMPESRGMRRISYRRLETSRLAAAYPLLIAGEDRSLRPTDTTASDCTSGKLFGPATDVSRRVLGALEEVKRTPPKRVWNRSDSNEYLVFIVTDGTGNHGEQFVPDPASRRYNPINPLFTNLRARNSTGYGADRCNGPEGQKERADGMLYTVHPSNSRILYNHVAIHGGPRVIAIYERGVGAAPYDLDMVRDLVQSGYSYLTVTDFLRVVNNAYKQAAVRINEVYARNPHARFVFVTSGFSRGAAAARALHHKLLNEGIANNLGTPGKRHIVAPGQARIAASVLYDTVVALDPNPASKWVLGRMYDNHQAQKYLRSASYGLPSQTQTLHVVAENEYRPVFALTQAKGPHVREIWVPGAHADIGGTYTTDGISAVTLLMGLHYLSMGGVPVGEPNNNFGLASSYLPNPNRLAIHDSRFHLSREPDLSDPTKSMTFNEALKHGRRTIERRLDINPR